MLLGAIPMNFISQFHGKMIKLRMQSLPGCLILLFITSTIYGQAGSASDSGVGKRSAKLDINKVPRIVTETFNKQFPVKSGVGWYGYPQFDNGSDWYEYDPSYFSNHNPENYVVEFTHNDTLDKVFYTKSGQKIATHRRINTVLPAKIADAIRKSVYKTWSIGNDKEEIFKDGKSDQIRVYRVMVRTGKERHTLYFQENGKLLRVVKSVSG
jgi:hypothetical protein